MSSHRMRLSLGLGLMLALGGCATYDYVGSGGGYYSGQPTTEYRYQDGYGYDGYGYGYPYYAPGSTLSLYYGRNYPYGYGSWAYPGPYYPGGYYVRPPQHPHPPRPRPDGGGNGPAPGGNAGGGTAPPRDRDRAPWREIGRLRDEAEPGPRTSQGPRGPAGMQVQQRQPAVTTGPRPTSQQIRPAMPQQQVRPQAQPRPVQQARPAAQPRPAQQARPAPVRQERPQRPSERTENQRTLEP